jgi:hypothetical protein
METEIINIDWNAEEVTQFCKGLSQETAKGISSINIDFKDGKPDQATLNLINGFQDIILFK